MRNPITNISFFPAVMLKRFLFLFLTIVAVTLFSAEIAKNHDVRIGVLADRGIDKCVKQWSPTANYLTNHIPGYTFHIVPLTFKDAVTQVKNEKLDFMLINPGIYIDLESKYGALRIATLLKQHKGKGYSTFGGVIITRSDRDDIKKVSDLKGKTFAAPAPNSFVAWNAICRELQGDGINPRKDFSKIEYLESHDLVIEAVKNGKVDAGSIRTEVLELLADAGKINLEDFRILSPKKLTPEFPFTHSTRLYPEWLLASFPGTSVELVKKVAAVLLYMTHEHLAAKSANLTGWAIPANYESVRECLKAVKAPPYEHYGEVTFTQALRQHWVLFSIIFFLLIFVVILSAHLFQRNRQLLKSTKIIRDKEEKLRTERDKIKGILTVMPDGIYIIGRKFDMEYVNPVIIDTFGEVKGRKCYEYLHGLPNPCSNCTLHKVLAGESVEMEWTDSRNNRIYEVFNTPYRNSDGSVALLARLRDITARKHAQENLKATLNSIGDAVISTDKDGIILWMNPAASEMLQIDDENIIGKNINKCINIFRIGEDEEEEPLNLGVDSVSDPSSALKTSDTAMMKVPNGERIELLISSAPIKSSDKVLGSVIVMRDITEQRKIESRLHQSQKMESLGQLAGGMAHDFNNMLCGITGAADLLKMRIDNSEMVEYVDLILNASSRAGDLTHSLLTFSRKKEIVFTVIDIHDVIEETLGIVRRTFDKNIDIKVEKSAENSRIKGDAALLQNCFMNLCINARDAMPGGGELTISTTNVNFDSVYCEDSPCSLKPGEYLEINIRDTGTGMEQKDLKKIFEPFFTTKALGKGTGLGLAMVYSAMVDHHGTVTVYSELNHGTVFHLYLPLAKEPEHKGKNEQIFYGSGRILVVDDEEIIRKMSKRLLESFGYTVLMAENGKEGVEAYRKNKEKIDLVILDAVMPEMNGFECLNEIRKINPEVKVLLVSGFVQEKRIEDFEKSGICGFIQKPYRKELLSKAVFDAVNNRD